MYRQGPLGCIPDAEGCDQGQSEADRCRHQRDAEVIDQIVGDQGADDADQHDRQPVGPRHIAFLTELQDKRPDQDRRHDQRCRRQA